MAIFDKIFKVMPRNFKSILIITYGRSGSTLLQGVLNNNEGVIIWGENNNMCYHMFKAYKAILKSKKQNGKFKNNPFYGSELLDAELFLTQTQKTINCFKSYKLFGKNLRFVFFTPIFLRAVHKNKK